MAKIKWGGGCSLKEHRQASLRRWHFGRGLMETGEQAVQILGERVQAAGITSTKALRWEGVWCFQARRSEWLEKRVRGQGIGEAE